MDALSSPSALPSQLPSLSVPEQRGENNAQEGLIEEIAQCRFCLEDASVTELIAPCQCVGTGRYVHAQCLRKWQTEITRGDQRASICQACRTPFSLEPPPPLLVSVRPSSRAALLRELRSSRPVLPIFEQLSTNPYFDDSLVPTLSNSLRNKIVACICPGCIVIRRPDAAPPVIRGEHWSRGVFLIGGVWPRQGHASADALVGVNIAGARCESVDIREVQELAELQNCLNTRMRLVSGGPVKPHRWLVVLGFRGPLTANLPPRVKVIPSTHATTGRRGSEDASGIACSGALFGEPTDVLEAVRGAVVQETIGAVAYHGHAIWSDTQLLSEVARCNWGLSRARGGDLAAALRGDADLWSHFWSVHEPVCAERRAERVSPSPVAVQAAAGCTPNCVVS